MLPKEAADVEPVVGVRRSGCFGPRPRCCSQEAAAFIRAVEEKGLLAPNTDLFGVEDPEDPDDTSCGRDPIMIGVAGGVPEGTPLLLPLPNGRVLDAPAAQASQGWSSSRPPKGPPAGRYWKEEDERLAESNTAFSDPEITSSSPPHHQVRTSIGGAGDCWHHCPSPPCR